MTVTPAVTRLAQRTSRSFAPERGPVPQPAEARPAPKVTWRAGSDRVAHAHTARATRTLCGAEIVAERLSWTKFRNCMVCTAAVEQGLGL
jgi:hypothetical protein